MVATQSSQTIEKDSAALKTEENIQQQVNFIIAHIDHLFNQQLNKILHHPSFQKLEASWRGLQYLISQAGDYERIKIRVISIKANELAKDVSGAIEFDQSQLFKKVYSNEFDQPGGEPFGLLIGDYEVTHHFSNQNKLGVDALREIAKVAAAAFSPFIAAASPEIFGLDSFADLLYTIELSHAFQLSNFIPWMKLRSEEDTRFIGLVMPGVLFRLPYNRGRELVDKFYFVEKTMRHADYLWGNAAYCFAANVARAFSYYGWFSEIRGIERNKINKGVVTGLPNDEYFKGCYEVNCKSFLETNISLMQEKDLDGLGFITLCDAKYSPHAVFYSCKSIHKPSSSYSKKIAVVNSKLSIQLDYILCISRFAHYIKVMIKDKIGSFISAEECEQYLQNWLIEFTADVDSMSPENKIKYPLREAKVRVDEQRGKNGSYYCTMQLKPHFQTEALESTLQLVTLIKL